MKPAPPSSTTAQADSAGPGLTAALAAMAGGDTVELELELETTTGRQCFQVNLKRLPDSSGKSTGTVRILNDVTELRRNGWNGVNCDSSAQRKP